jgi:hypothetical protein
MQDEDNNPDAEQDTVIYAEQDIQQMRPVDKKRLLREVELEEAKQLYNNIPIYGHSFISNAAQEVDELFKERGSNLTPVMSDVSEFLPPNQIPHGEKVVGWKEVPALDVENNPISLITPVLDETNVSPVAQTLASMAQWQMKEHPDYLVCNIEDHGLINPMREQKIEK